MVVSGWAGMSQRAHLLTVAVGHALAFGTCRSLVREQGLDDKQAVALMVALVTCAPHQEQEAGDTPLTAQSSVRHQLQNV